MPELWDAMLPADAAPPDLWTASGRRPVSYEGVAPAAWARLMQGTPDPDTPSLWPDPAPPPLDLEMSHAASQTGAQPSALWRGLANAPGAIASGYRYVRDNAPPVYGAQPGAILKYGEGVVQSINDLGERAVNSSEAFRNRHRDTVDEGQQVDLSPFAETAGMVFGSGGPYAMLKGGAAAGAGGGKLIQPGIRAFHGSPHDFDRFDISKIGTGEGAQSYGHGLYFADREGTARAYRDALQSTTTPHVTVDGERINMTLLGKMKHSADPEERWLAQNYQRVLGSRGKSALDTLQKELTEAERMQAQWLQRKAEYQANPPLASTLGVKDFEERAAAAATKAERLRAMLPRLKQETGGPTGKMYEVNINARPEQFLDWDRPLAGQKATEAMPSLLEVARAEAKDRAIGSTRLARQNELWDIAKNPEMAPGEFAYRALSRSHGDPYGLRPQASVARAMRDAGIPGVKYLDQGSRGRTVATLDPQIEKYQARLATDKGLSEFERSEIQGSLDDLLAERKRVAAETSNYVVNDDKLIDILKKYAITGVAGTGAALAPGLFGGDEAEAAPKTGPLWSNLSKEKLSKSLDEMQHGYSDVRVPEQKVISPEKMVGGNLILTPSDLSVANRTLTHVDGTPINPVKAHGGVGFPEATPGMAWASEAPVARKLDNQAAELAKTGKPVYIAPMTMSPQSIDASHHVAGPLSQLVQQAKIGRADATAFNDLMKEAVPDWVSIRSPKFQEYIDNLQGGMKTKALMAKVMAQAKWQEKGFPNVAAIRHAMTEPGLIDVPRNTSGMAISEYIPGKGLLESGHPSYSKGVAGRHLGMWETLMGFDDVAPSIAKGLAQVNAANKAAGKKTPIQPAYHMGKPTEGVPTHQVLDDEWLDNIMKKIEAAKSGR